MTLATCVRAMRLGGTTLAALIAATGTAAPPAHADEIRLLSAAAMQTVFHMITDEFERTSGHHRGDQGTRDGGGVSTRRASTPTHGTPHEAGRRYGLCRPATTSS
jgi:hypothetical protein